MDGKTKSVGRRVVEPLFIAKSGLSGLPYYVVDSLKDSLLHHAGKYQLGLTLS